MRQAEGAFHRYPIDLVSLYHSPEAQANIHFVEPNPANPGAPIPMDAGVWKAVNGVKLDTTDRKLMHDLDDQRPKKKTQPQNTTKRAQTARGQAKKVYPATCTTVWEKKVRKGELTMGNRRVPQPPPREKKSEVAPPIGPPSKSRAYTQTPGVVDTSGEGLHGKWSVSHIRPSLSYTARECFLSQPVEPPRRSVDQPPKALVDFAAREPRGLRLGGRRIGPPGPS